MGRGLGKLLAQKGANVVIVARNAKKLEEALKYISVRIHSICSSLFRPTPVLLNQHLIDPQGRQNP